MKLYQPNEPVLMHGPAFDGSGVIVEREVPASDVAAFRRAGYERGPMPESERLKAELAALKETRSDAAETPAKATKKAKTAK